MMKCGHSANATRPGPIGQKPTTSPCCAICAPSKEAYEIDPSPPDLRTREARCPSCDARRPSSPDLAFFEHTPTKPFDSFYCGCCGWD
jgi:hypothetical protein